MTEKKKIDKVAEQHKKDGMVLLEEARQMRITNDEEYVAAGQFLIGVKALQKQIKAHHKPMLVKAQESKRAAEATRKAIADGQDEALTIPLEAEKILKGAMNGFEFEQEQKRLEAEKAQQAALESSAGSPEQAPWETQSMPIPPEAVAPPPPKVEGISTVEKWSYELLDIRKCRDPTKYCALQDKVVKKVVEAMGPEAVGLIGEGCIRVFPVKEKRVRA